jgi:hypothetical protein
MLGTKRYNRVRFTDGTCEWNADSYRFVSAVFELDYGESDYRDLR